jgi:cytochrome c
MTFAKGATALALVLGLAACGSSEVDTTAETTTVDTTSAMAPAATAASDTATAAATTADTSAMAPAGKMSPTPSPTPSASPSAKATPVAAATKPAEFAQCSACHSTERGKNGIGPSLAGVYGTKAGAVPGYDFSDAMRNSGLTWNQGTLDRFLTDPKGVIPGTKMTFPGLKDPAKRAAVIAYLKSI